jgi:hypothetical protein
MVSEKQIYGFLKGKEISNFEKRRQNDWMEKAKCGKRPGRNSWSSFLISIYFSCY